MAIWDMSSILKSATIATTSTSVPITTNVPIFDSAVKAAVGVQALSPSSNLSTSDALLLQSAGVNAPGVMNQSISNPSRLWAYLGIGAVALFFIFRKKS